MGFQQGLSGLNISAKSLDVISHNVANANTSGFKASQSVFADVFSSTLGANPYMQVGSGGSLPAVRQNFNQGGVTNTGNALDMAINGDGFFMVKRPVNGDEQKFYTRAGEFQLDKDGNVTTASGYQVLGYPGSSGAGDPVGLTVPFDAGKPKATPDVAVQVNLDANEDVKDPAQFDAEDPETYNFSTTVQSYDSLGIPHTLSLYYVKTSEADATWDVFWSMEGHAASNPPLQITDALDFNASGLLEGTSGTLETPVVGSSRALLNIDLGGALDNSAFMGTETAPATYDNQISLTLSPTQFSLPSSVSTVSQGGYPPGELAAVSVTREGRLQARYTNGDVKDVGTIAVASFRNPNGLISMGDSLWSATLESGEGVAGNPGSGTRGLIQGGAIEDSNVDLTAELVQMIIQQRAYQANAQSIRTQDQILQTVINLR